MILPLRGEPRVSQWFGENPDYYSRWNLAGHNGVDYVVPVGTPVYASHSGILEACNGPTYGIHAYVRGSGYETVYAHLSEVRTSGSVKEGERIGLSGNTGNSTGPHLHWSCRKDGFRCAPFNHWLNPLRFLDDTTEHSKLTFHVQQPQYPAWLKSHVRRSQQRWIKLMDPDFGEAFPFGMDKLYIGRFWTSGEPDKELMWQGRAGADAWFNMLRSRIERCWWLHVTELPNEPAVDSVEKAHAFVAFTKRCTEHLHSIGMLAGTGCFSTGNPSFELWPIIANGLTDCFVRHEYGMRTMTLDGWHLLRYRREREYIVKALGYMPPVLITETGIDYGGDPRKDGWKAQGLSESQYLSQLAAYDRELRLDPYVLTATPFTWLDAGWPSFVIGESMSNRLVEYIQAEAIAPDTAIANAAQGWIIPLNPYSAFERWGSARGYLPASKEFDTTINGVVYRAQAYRDPDERDAQHIVYCQVGDWGNLKEVVKSN